MRWKQQGLFVGVAVLGLAACSPSTRPAVSMPAEADATPPATYAMDDYARVRKFDAHVHANGTDPVFLQLARSDNFELLSINVDYPDFPTLEAQHRLALALAREEPQRFHWAASFTMKGFGTPGWLARTNQSLDAAVAEGARAVKVWKNIGMVERNARAS